MFLELTTEEEFKHFKSIRDCYIVITDTTRKLIHTTRCDDVNITSFREKVLSNSKNNGRYFFTDDLVEGILTFNAKKCQNCRPK